MAEVILTKNNKQLISYRVIKQEQDNSICSEKYCFLVPLEGNVLVAQKKEIFEMVPKDVLLIQPLTRYVLSTIHGVCLLYEVDFARMDVDLIEALNGVVCNSSLEKGKARYQWMIYYILRSLEPGKGEVSFITERKWLCQILEELLNKCTMDPGRAHHIQTEEQEILDYIGRHYKEQLSLSTLSTRFYVSKSSVSKMFKEKIGSSFLEYLTEIRMMHAVGYLQNPEKTIEQIAEENGFTNARSFSTKFQEYYQMLPSEYRKQRGIVCQESLQEEDSRYLSAFLEQIEGSLKGETHAPLPLKKQIIADVCVQQSVQLGNPDKIISINRAADLLIYQNYEIICQLVRNLGFRYIYFHEIFHSDMEIYITDRNGKPWLSFYKLDQLFDFVMECGLTPFVELSFLPRWMSGLDEPDTIRMESVAEMPRDMRQWKELVESVVRHLIARYGIREVLRWRFCIWNSPDNPDKIPMVSQPENYQKLYLETWRTLKQIHPDLQTGLPALMCFSLLHPSWMKAFSFFCRENSCTPDFAMVNIFPVEESDELPRAGQMKPIMREPDAICSIVRKIRDNNDIYHWAIPRFFVAEWNFDFFVYSKLSETMFLPCYIVKNMVDCWNEGFDFGVLDPIGSLWQSSLQAKGIGRQVLIAGNNIKMPAFYAYKMLNRMGKHLIRKGDNFLITRKEHQIQILLYNYHHLSEAYCTRKLDYAKWQTEFWEEFHELEYEIRMKQFGQEGIRKETFILREDQGNACMFCERYLRVDQEQMPDQEMIDYINGKSQPLRMLEVVYPQADGSLYLYETLQPHEVRLICLSERWESGDECDNCVMNK